MREGELLRRIFARSADLPREFPQVLTGPGDDCAVIASRGVPLLLKVDQVVEGRHFTRETPIDLVARKAIARAVSDIAAMAGTPVATLVGAVLPQGYAHADALYDALLRWSRHFACPLVGGDTASYAGTGPHQAAPLTLSVTVLGSTHASRGPVHRSGARVGDNIFVTGTIGGSFIAQGGPFPGSGKHLLFEPRVREAASLAGTLGADLHAMMDISDGLGIDAARMAERSGVAVEMDASRVPLSPGLSDVQQACADGEDYELLFTAAPEAAIPSSVGGTPVTCIGRVVAFSEGGPRSMLRVRNVLVSLDNSGWEHRA